MESNNHNSLHVGKTCQSKDIVVVCSTVTCNRTLCLMRYAQLLLHC